MILEVLGYMLVGAAIAFLAIFAALLAYDFFFMYSQAAGTQNTYKFWRWRA